MKKITSTLRLGVRAEKIDPAQKAVTLAGGEKLGYEKLLVATGSRPFDPPMEGIERVKERFHFMTKADALALDKALSPEKKVLIVGAGLIGLKCFEGIAARVKSAAIVDMADRILPAILDETGGEDGAEAHWKRTARNSSYPTASKALKAIPPHLKSGKAVPFDILVIAVGVRPNTELVKEAGGEVRRGIAADAGGRTSLPDVFAAGDCAESFDAVRRRQQGAGAASQRQHAGAHRGRQHGGRKGGTCKRRRLQLRRIFRHRT